tara:strand:+ start:1001 stop:1258 length:258 start_codon:yes stop_codon:yes gene_type:complete
MPRDSKGGKKMSIEDAKKKINEGKLKHSETTKIIREREHEKERERKWQIRHNRDRRELEKKEELLKIEAAIVKMELMKIDVKRSK